MKTTTHAVIMLTIVSVGPTRLTAAPVTGVYDENSIQSNAVDFEAPGSNIPLAQFSAEIADAFQNNRGGVNHGYVAEQLPLEFGIDESKTLIVEEVEGTRVGSGLPSNTVWPISGSTAMASHPMGGFNYTAFAFSSIIGAEPDEQIVALGVTTLSVTDNDYGNVTMTGRLASGATISATRRMNEPAGLGDTFFGLRAPDFDYFTGFTLSYDGTPSNDNRLWFDDVGFITDVVTVPEPASALLVFFACAITRRRRRV